MVFGGRMILIVGLVLDPFPITEGCTMFPQGTTALDDILRWAQDRQQKRPLPERLKAKEPLETQRRIGFKMHFATFVGHPTSSQPH